MDNSKFVQARRTSRIMVVWNLYSIEIHNEPGKFTESLDEIVASWYKKELRLNKLPAGIDKKLLKKFDLIEQDDFAPLDDHIQDFLSEDWYVDMLAAPLRAILRAGVFEIINNIAPAKVIINEYTSITAGFFGAEETGFVNGLLENLALAQGKLDKDKIDIAENTIENAIENAAEEIVDKATEFKDNDFDKAGHA